MDAQFRRRFRMRRHVFERLVDVVQQVDPYFIQRPNCAGEIGLSALQKVVAAVRILAYGIPADAVDEYVRIGESTAHEALKHFCTAVQTAFAPYYLRAPNAEDIARLLQVGESRGFPGMLGSVDCMHWEWRNCGVLADTTQGSMEERNDFVNQRYNQLKDRNKYTQLQVDLIHHHWARHGAGVA
ncbi:uncharacterized protein [Zea mays]|uniref:uncharacterized protein n=1 Tax=Zea mays TaxID=4577 RepID=UPI0004DEC646|nr:uncharacterized protein LOC103639310 [Zea mays]|eukprot:XP_020399796.1 uncharacterized protein LOC103639310 [Zea mays]